MHNYLTGQAEKIGMNFNKAFVLGNLTRDPELKSLPSGMPVANFGVASNRVWKDKSGQQQKEAEFHNVVVFGRLAEIAGQYLKKGQLVFVEGRIKTRNWQDQSGHKNYRTEIIGENFQMGPKSSGSGNSFAGRAEESGPSEIPEINLDDEEEIKSGEIPF